MSHTRNANPAPQVSFVQAELDVSVSTLYLLLL
jgi:hypothetical protein